jgi:hypothetical protein
MSGMQQATRKAQFHMTRLVQGEYGFLFLAWFSLEGWLYMGRVVGCCRFGQLRRMGIRLDGLVRCMAVAECRCRTGMAVILTRPFSLYSH